MTDERKPIVWNKGAPPHVGWWRAKLEQVEEDVERWTGSNWSTFAQSGDSPEAASVAAQHPGRCEVDRIVWSKEYPENAPAPRLDPREGWLSHTGKSPVPPTFVIDVIRYNGRRARLRAGAFEWEDASPLKPNSVYAWRRKNKSNSPISVARALL